MVVAHCYVGVHRQVTHNLPKPDERVPSKIIAIHPDTMSPDNNSRLQNNTVESLAYWKYTVRIGPDPKTYCVAFSVSASTEIATTNRVDVCFADKITLHTNERSSPAPSDENRCGYDND